MNVAFVYDRINKYGGAERILQALHDIWPDAPIYTAVYNKKTAGWADGLDVRPSFLQYAPFARQHHELYPWLTPFAFETFSFEAYDCVISVTSAEAKSIITLPETLHICYCLTPTRYLWSGFYEYQTNPALGVFSAAAGRILGAAAATLRRWDTISASRPDMYVAISERVKRRIETYYGRDVADIIYPPIQDDVFHSNGVSEPGEYYLTVARLVGYKKVDLVIEACNRLKAPLIVIGDGKHKSELKKIAGPTIRFISEALSDEELARYYRGAKAFVYAGEEDFGIVAAEAQACHTPVVAYAESGMSEIITPGKTGVVFDKQTPNAIITALAAVVKLRYDRTQARKNTEALRVSVFKTHMKRFVTDAWSARNKHI